MTWKRMIFFGFTVAIVAIAYFGWKLTARGAYESAEYTVIEADKLFEIREYPDLMMATTSMQFETQGSDGSFMRLFRYISGENDNEQKVAMTIPVFIESEAHNDHARMGFVIPKKVTGQRVPDPCNKGVEISKRIGGRFAVIRFAGQMDSESVAEAENKLRKWMNRRGLIDDGESDSASYDPPWTPGPLRRNEVLIRLQ